MFERRDGLFVFCELLFCFVALAKAARCFFESSFASEEQILAFDAFWRGKLGVQRNEAKYREKTRESKVVRGMVFRGFQP